MGGLRRVMPLTAFVFSVGALSLGGIPILAGFWSKDEIMVTVSEHRNVAFIVFALVTALLSALYMARAVFVAFFGPLRRGLEHVHDAPWLMAGPMVLLGVLAAGFGFLSFNWPGSYSGVGGFVFFGERHGFEFTWWLGILSAVLAVGAFVYAFLVYVTGRVSLENARERFAPVLRVVENKYYFDELYQWVVDRVVLVVSAFVALFDRVVVNDVAVNGPANSVRRLGNTLRLHVTGHVYSYMLAMVLGSVGLAIFWWLRSA
jgi:NADH-quinone oxidoreductase subunit L